MSPPFDDVLLTAYLDDEVTDVERAIVEERLRSSEASRQLLEELRSVRNLVVQLHLTQPSRAFSKGPWNESKSNSVDVSAQSKDGPKVLLTSTYAYGRMPWKTLASVAALIAITVCSSVFLIKPFGRSISKSDANRNKDGGASTIPENWSAVLKAKRNATEAESAQASLSSNLPTRSLSEMDSGGRFRGSEVESLRNLKEDREAKLSDAESKEDKASLEKAFSLGDMLAEPAPAQASAPPMPGAKTDGMKAEYADGQVVQTDPTLNKLIDALAEHQDIVLTPELAHRVEPSNVLSFAIIEDFVPVNGPENLSSGDSPSSLFFRYSRVPTEVPAKLNPKLAEDKKAEGLFSEDTPIDRNSGIAQKPDEIANKPRLLEFQIPSDNWEAGSKRLRTLGISVPEELPVVEFLDYIAVPVKAASRKSVSDSPITELDVGNRVAKSSDWYQWSFQQASPTHPNLSDALGLENPAEKKSKGTRPLSRTVRVRVRVIDSPK